jgi:prolipoprotein diacylglyceryltransferase
MPQTFIFFGIEFSFYYLFHAIGYIGTVIFYVYYGKKYGLKQWQTLSILLPCYIVVYLWIYVLSWAESGFRVWGGNNIVRAFIYLPLLFLISGKIFRIKFSLLSDLFAPALCLAQGISHIGCIFQGCCGGYQCSWGIYNRISQVTLFPVQLFEAATALAIVVILIAMSLKEKYIPTGHHYPLMLVLFGTTRVFWELFRDNEKILLGFSVLSIHALLMAVIGAVWLIILNKRRKAS